MPVDNPEGLNLVLGQSHFIKTVEDLHEALVGTSPYTRFGLAFCEASGPCLVRRSGNDDDLVQLATVNAERIGAGHSFIVFLREACHVFCATANPVSVVVAVTGTGRGILGVIDGSSPLGVESDKDVADRKGLMRAIGYKL